ncbi:ABC transporter permease subunit [Ignicoccus hospitalis]|uniref:Binding-protein-dependent transport systems inner membrane component n=1 Tax=Ignicoccus hospitalis (strain KIN4/I / DSM 18386 / JCM 14125) TaxID=453591 RepID=A8AB96_IGNH4|nr:ABC transporter permease subunit [Ignicoccus hospitalis]ABU82198.1 binding-protein-dependent transport systems inner membrane component [Ignicoccus hospitalis KIN4/I]HIH91156.1 ABC transporter permease subunit [Desulfurococcaceae archaeon]
MCGEGLPLEPPSPSHPLGTTPLGEDALCALAAGLWTSLEVAAVSYLTSFALLTALHYLSFARKGVLAEALSDLLLSLPRLPLLVLLGVKVTLSPLLVGALVGALASSAGVKVIKEAAERLREQPFALASFASGASPGEAWRLHGPRNALELVSAYAGLSSAIAIYAEAAISALGLEDPSTPSLGRLAYLVLNTPGAALTEAGAAQLLASALSTVAVAEVVRRAWRLLRAF